MERVPSPTPSRRFVACVVTLACALGRGDVKAAEPVVVGVVACDGYADLKDQIRWVGTQIGNPALDGFAESFVMMATQFRGLAGLDVTRPAGVILTADDAGPSGHGFVPVKDLDRLLGSLEGVLGPVERSGDVRRIAPPGGMPLDIVERDGWAVLSPRGQTCAIEDPTPFFRPLVETCSIAAEAYPAKMPPPLRQLLRQALGQLAAMAGAQGQQVDPGALDAALDALDDAESIRWGIDVDAKDGSVAIENAQVAVRGSTPAAMLGGDVGTPLTMATGPAGDADRRAIEGHWCSKAAASLVSSETLASVLPSGSGDASTEALFGVLRDVVQSMAETGGLEVALTADTAEATADAPLPALTVALRVKDGKALEKLVKTRLGAADALPPGVQARFDTSRAGAATLHAIDVGGVPGLPGGRVEATLAIAPTSVFILTGADVPRRIEEAIAASGRPQQGAEALGRLTAHLAPLFAYAGRLAGAFAPDDPNVERMESASTVAAGEPSATVALLARPIERGVRYRLRADGGAVKAIATLMSASPAVEPAAGPGAGRLPRGAPALAP